MHPYDPRDPYSRKRKKAKAQTASSLSPLADALAKISDERLAQLVRAGVVLAVRDRLSKPRESS